MNGRIMRSHWAVASIWRRLGVLVTSLTLLGGGFLIAAPPAAAVVCGGEAFVKVYEFQNYQDNHDFYSGMAYICYPDNIPNFGHQVHGSAFVVCDKEPGGCVIPHDCNGNDTSAPLTWDDCISAINYNSFPAGNILAGCFYQNANYTGRLVSYSKWSGSVILSGANDNVISSFRWRSSPATC